MEQREQTFLEFAYDNYRPALKAIEPLYRKDRAIAHCQAVYYLFVAYQALKQRKGVPKAWLRPLAKVEEWERISATPLLAIIMMENSHQAEELLNTATTNVLRLLDIINNANTDIDVLKEHTFETLVIQWKKLIALK